MAGEPKKCKNIFFEDDGYCTLCGSYHFTQSFGKIYFHEDPIPDVNQGYDPPFGGTGANGLIGLGGVCSDPDSDSSGECEPLEDD